MYCFTIFSVYKRPCTVCDEVVLYNGEQDGLLFFGSFATSYATLKNYFDCFVVSRFVFLYNQLFGIYGINLIYAVNTNFVIFMARFIANINSVSACQCIRITNCCWCAKFPMVTALSKGITSLPNFGCLCYVFFGKFIIAHCELLN